MKPSSRPQETAHRLSAYTTMMDEVLAQAACEVWPLYFNSQLTPAVETTHLPQNCAMITACISLKGDWRGGVLLVCPAQLVDAAATALFGECSDDEPQDAAKDLLGEVANTIAGSVAGALPGAVSLSLPVIAQGVDLAVSVQDGQPVRDVHFTCGEQPVRLVLLESQPGTFKGA